MAEDQNSSKQQGKGQTTLQGQIKPDDGKRSQKQPGQDLSIDQAGGPLKEQTNQNKLSEQR